MNYLKLEYNRLYEQVISQIEEHIQAGRLRPGDKMPSERQLSELMGVSRGTLREAFRILENQGVIETKPGGGRYLRAIFPRDGETGNDAILSGLQKAAIIDLLEVRELLEIKMVELACQRISKQEIAELEAMLDHALANEHLSRDINYEFHFRLAEATRNIVFVNFMKLNLNIMDQARERTFTDKQNFLEAQLEHRAILEAIKKRDVEEARSRTEIHIKNIRKRIQK